MSHARIRRIFDTRLAAFALSKQIRVSYDNVPFEPESDETYLVANLMPAATDCDTLSGDHNLYVGLYKIKVVTGSGMATGDVEELADGLKALFPTYALYKDGSFQVQSMTPLHIPEGRAQAGSWVVPCHFDYRADTN